MLIANKNRRVAASMIDLVFILFLSLAVLIPWSFLVHYISGPHVYEKSDGQESNIEVQNTLWMVCEALCVAAVGIFYTLSESSIKMGTPGKRMLGIAVTDLKGMRISRLRAFTRFILRLILVVLVSVFGLTTIGLLLSEQKVSDGITSLLAALIFATCLLFSVNRKNQRVYDLLTGTILVNNNRIGGVL